VQTGQGRSRPNRASITIVNAAINVASINGRTAAEHPMSRGECRVG